MTVKDPSITRLRTALPMTARDWIVVDHWDADLTAIGIARRSQPRHLVYVSTHGRAAGRYYFECEAPTGPHPTDFKVTEVGNDVDFDTLLQAMIRHLSPQ